MDVADVARVVVAGDDDERVALDLVEVLARLLVLGPEAERRQVAGADDDLRLEVVDLVDRALEQARHEVRPPAVQVGDVRDPEAAVLHRSAKSRLTLSIFAIPVRRTVESDERRARAVHAPHLLERERRRGGSDVIQRYGAFTKEVQRQRQARDRRQAPADRGRDDRPHPQRRDARHRRARSPRRRSSSAATTSSSATTSTKRSTYAAKIPAAEHGSVEVRPVWAM